MKTASAIITNVTVGPSDTRMILWKVMKEQKGVVEQIIKDYLRKQGARVKNVEAVDNSQLPIYLRSAEDQSYIISIEESDPAKVKAFFPEKVGFLRGNTGFHRALVVFLRSNGGSSHTTEAFETLRKAFPNLSERQFSIYIRDKREQKSKKYSFNSTTSVLSVRDK